HVHTSRGVSREERQAHVVDGQAEPAITIEIPSDDVDRFVCRVVRGRRLEGAVAVAQQHRDIARTRGRHSEVEPAVAVEIPRYKRYGDSIYHVLLRGIERAFAIPQENGNVLGYRVGEDQVEPAVAAEVTGHHGRRRGSRRILHGVLETAVP